MATEQEFDAWCDQVDEIVKARMGDQVDEERQRQWDYSLYFSQWMTCEQAANLLYEFLKGGE